MAGCISPGVGYETDGEVVGWLTKMHILFPLGELEAMRWCSEPYDCRVQTIP